MINPSELEWDTTHHGWVSGQRVYGRKKPDKLLCPSKKKSMDVHICAPGKTGHVCNGFKCFSCKQESTELGIDLQLGSSLLT